MKNYPLPAVAALIIGPSERLLLVKTTKWSGLWGVPGGKIEYGEGVIAALRREMREEVGLEIHSERFAFISEINHDPQFYKPAHFISLEYIATSDSSAVVPNEEIAEFAWLTLPEAKEYPVNEYTRLLLEWYEEHRG